MIDVNDTIPWDRVCFIDSETRSRPLLACEDPRWYDITATSVDRYAARSWPIIITYASGLEGEVKVWTSKDVTRPPAATDLPPELEDWYARGNYFAAWNSRFDRLQLRALIAPETDAWLDMMVQAAYNNSPLGLDRAAHSVGDGGKVQAGKALIHLFCSADGATPEEKPEEWARFVDYAKVDISSMQAFAAGTFPVPREIWEESWVSEDINDRGLPFDVGMARGGAKLADEYAERLGDVMASITDGAITGPKQFVRQRAWVWEKIRHNPFVAEHMIVAHRFNEELMEDEYVLKMDRPRITKMIAALNTLDEKSGLTDDEWAALQLLEEREWGASSAPMKFDKMLAMGVWEGDENIGTLPGQYLFSGAMQTGRFSSRGVQVHNMTRSTVGSIEDEEEACAMLGDGVDLEQLEASLGNPGKALSRLIRPTIIAPIGDTLVWGDWANIEARALPWLAEAETRLELFRRIDADPENEPDVYLHAAAGMYHHEPYDLLAQFRAKEGEAKTLRQKGKVSELALGFNGGPGALQNMAANYGMSFESAEAKDIVDRWRAANPWAVEYWGTVWDAFTKAVGDPGGKAYKAGRVSYQGLDVAGEIWVAAILPDGRPLFYRDVRTRVSVEYDPFDSTVVLSKEQKLSFISDEGTKWLWPGLLVENITQAICASILRAALVRIEKRAPDLVVGHTHDEIICLTSESTVALATDVLREEMLFDPGWLKGLPLGVDIVSNTWYSKAIED